ncbi:MAG: zinc ribbon domain-containing protein [Ruminococcaceae bacterium]|nr:zinc ribbon domain-containing protein [Oscillospiraceae bacterium]
MVCNFCGKEIPNNAQFCSHCGANKNMEAGGVSGNIPQEAPENRVYVNTTPNNTNLLLYNKIAKFIAAINLLVFWPGTILHFVLNFLGNWNPAKKATAYKASCVLGTICIVVGAILLFEVISRYSHMSEAQWLSIVGLVYGFGIN